jgi:2-hydroxychromene-2-carboxylate isomerase
VIEQQVSTIDYYVWLLSDWAYLGGVRFVQLATRHGLKINHSPLRMQDVYAGSGGVLLANRSWQRQAYRITELKRWRSRLGIPVNIEPKFFPVDVDLASCVVIAAQQRGLPVADFVNAVMRAIWAEDQNVADPGVLVTIAERCGLEGRQILDAANAEAVRADTTETRSEPSPPACSGRRSTPSRANCSGVRTALICSRRQSCDQSPAIRAVVPTDNFRNRLARAGRAHGRRNSRFWPIAKLQRHAISVAFGVKRTSNGRRGRLFFSRMTRTGH